MIDNARIGLIEDMYVSTFAIQDVSYPFQYFLLCVGMKKTTELEQEA
jgi:hypothetical protein